MAIKIDMSLKMFVTFVVVVFVMEIEIKSVWVWEWFNMNNTDIDKTQNLSYMVCDLFKRFRSIGNNNAMLNKFLTRSHIIDLTQL